MLSRIAHATLSVLILRNGRRIFSAIAFKHSSSKLLICLGIRDGRSCI